MKSKLGLLLSIIPLSLTTCSAKSNNSCFGIYVNRNKEQVGLYLTRNLAVEKESIEIFNLPPIVEYTYSRLPDPYLLDSDEIWISDGIDSDNRMFFFNQTFYLQNKGVKVLRYILEVYFEEIDESIRKTLRIMLFHNRGSDEAHNYTVYALINRAGNCYGSYDEYVAEPYDSISNPNPLLAQPFLNDDFAARLDNHNFNPGDVDRYTFVMWLEGYDRDASIYSSASGIIKLGISIDVYEE